MAVMDGLKIAKIFKVACETNKIKSPPVILLTAYERDFFDEQDLLVSGCIYMKKPINADDLK